MSRSCISVTGIGWIRERKENAVSFLSGELAKEARLTKRDGVYHESSRFAALGKLSCSSLDGVHGRVVMLFDGIPIGDHQDDGPRSPKRTYMSVVSDEPDL